MKRLLSIPVLLILLAGCSLGNIESQTDKENKEKVGKAENVEKAEEKQPSDQKQEIVNKDVYVPNPQVTDDINLIKVGATVTDGKGDLTLKAIKNVKETVKVGPVEMQIKEVKVMHFVPDYSMIDFFHGFTHVEEFDLVKIAVEIQNTGDEAVKFNPIAALKLSTGEHKTWEDDVYLEELGGEIASKADMTGSMGFIIEDAKDLKSIELLTSDAVDLDHKKIEEAVKTKINF